MTNGFLRRPRCGVCGKTMMFSLENRYLPLEVMVLLSELSVPPTQVTQWECFHDQHGSVWSINVPNARTIWVY